jgi:uncharacterized membrane protein YkvA (DUF1232 family)
MQCEKSRQKSHSIKSRLKERARKLKEELYAIYLAAKDKRTPWYAKWLTAITIGYTLSPLDIIPDFIPVIGFLDELLIVPGLILLTIKMIPPNVLQEQKEKIQREGCPRLKPNWIFTCIIIGLWLVSIVFVLNLFIHIW